MGLVGENGDFPKSRWAFSTDALATIFGACFGLSPLTAYIESGAGVEAGSRTGLTALFIGFFFFLSLFFAPIIASIPPWATGGALIMVGALMCRSLKDIKWYNPTHAITAFLTVIVMPLTYSIAYGLIAGIGTFVVMEGTFLLLSFVGIPKPVYEDPDVIVAAPKQAEDDSEEQNTEEHPQEQPEEDASYSAGVGKPSKADDEVEV
jgi:adenine/guanine/hypoxanthine permease